MTQVEHVVVDEDILAEKSKLVLHVLEQTAHESREVDNMRRLVLFKQSACLSGVSAKRISISRSMKSQRRLTSNQLLLS